VVNGTGMSRHIVSSLFPEKLDFDGVEHRMPKYNAISEAIWLINSILEEKKRENT
jgi:hypothetical protein